MSQPVRAPRPTPNPWVWEAQDYIGKVVRITVTWNAIANGEGEHNVTAIQVFRDADCQYTKILIGTSVDGNPDDTDKTVTVPDGTTNLSQGLINALINRGIGTIEDILGFQITAGR